MDNQEICEALKIIKNVCKETKLKHKDDCAIPCMMCPLGNYHGDCCIVGTDPEKWQKEKLQLQKENLLIRQ